MNRITLFGLLLLSMFVSPLFGQEKQKDQNSLNEPRVQLVANPVGNLFSIVYEASDVSDLHIVIMDDDNNRLYHEKIKNTRQFIKPLNFSQVDAGTYTVMVSGKNVAFEEELTLEKSEFIVPEFTAEVTPIASSRRVRLEVKGNVDNNVYVEVLDPGRKVIFSGDVKLDMESGRTFNLEQSLYQKVIFRVVDASNVVEHQVSL